MILGARSILKGINQEPNVTDVNKITYSYAEERSDDQAFCSD